MRRPASGWIAAAFVGIAAIGLVGCGGSGGKGANGASLLVIDQIPIDGGQSPMTIPPTEFGSQQIVVLFSANPAPNTVLDPAEFNGLNANVRIIDSTLTRVNGKAFLGGVDGAGRTPEEVFPDINPTWAEEIAADGEDTLRFIYDTDGTTTTAEALPPEQYTIIVSSLVTNVRGRPILEPYCGSFTSGPDTYPPVIRVTDPTNGATEVDLASPFTFEFNESVIAGSVTGNPPATPSAVTMVAQATGQTGNPGLAIAGTVTSLLSNGCRFVFTPSSTLPGSQPGSAVVVTTTVNGTPQVSDQAGNVMAGAETTAFTMRNGPTISNNPIPPNALWFGALSPDGVGCIGVNSSGISAASPLLQVDTDGDGLATAADDNTLIATSINEEVGVPVDIVLGNVITPGHSLEVIPVPNPPMPLPLGSSMPGLPSACPLQTVPTPNSSNADIGTYFYVADSSTNTIRVLNSNTSLQIDSIPVPDPAGVAISANMQTLFVSNFGRNSVSVFNVNMNMNTLIKEVSVNPQDPAQQIGRGPRAIVSQPDQEDVCVLNTQDESMSLMSYARGFEVRKTVESSIGPDPVDLGATWRGATWLCYITNRGADTISVFESGPNFPVQAGPDDIKAVLEGGQGLGTFTIRRPTRVQTDLTTGLQGDGVWYVNSEDGTIGQINLTFIGPPPNPYFPNPAPSRVWGQTRVTPAFGRVADLALGDNLTPCLGFGINANIKNNFGQISAPIKGYVATTNSVRVFNARTATDTGIEIPVPGVNQLVTHWKQ